VGEFYRGLYEQRTDLKPKQTTQGLYIFSPDGKLYRAWNTRGGEKLKDELRAVLKEYKAPPVPASLEEDHDPSSERYPPKGTQVVNCFARVTKADWPSAPQGTQKIFQSATGREHLWVLKSEVPLVARGKLPHALVRRIARFHLNDFTRGEPDIWKPEDLKKVEMDLEPDGSGYKLTGEVEIEDPSGRAGYMAKLLGRVEANNGKLTKFDVVARGTYHGHGQFTHNSAPEGGFELVIAFALPPEGTGDALKAPPQGLQMYKTYLSP
jgi:hypothetical protein